MRCIQIYDILVFVYMTLCIIYGIMNLRIGKFYHGIVLSLQHLSKNPEATDDLERLSASNPLPVLQYAFFYLNSVIVAA